jgi:uncharacterized protein (DUF924 family)
MTREHDAGDSTKEILEYWFSTLDDGTPLDRAADPFRTCFTRWYGKDKAIDDEIRARFEPVLNAITSHGAGWEDEVERWRRTPRGLVALTILLDQLPRNMYRGTAAMYAHDPLALSVATIAMRENEADLLLVQQMFLYMPLMHAENLTLQQVTVRRFEGLVELAKTRSPKNEGFFRYGLDYAHKHLDVVRSYGRFPHRNALLGRESTAAELEYLKRDDADF